MDAPQLTEEIFNTCITMDLTDLNMEKIDYISFRHYSEDHHGAPEVCQIGTESRALCMAEIEEVSSPY